MTESCLPPQMTGYNTYFSLLKVKVDKPYQTVNVYAKHFSHYRKTVSLIGSLCVMVIPLYWQHTPALYGVR